MNDMDDYTRLLLESWPAYRFVNSMDGQTCNDCKRRVGLGANECTGWHPAFRCQCGYETTHPAAANWKNCVHCGRAIKDILDAEEVG